MLIKCLLTLASSQLSGFPPSGRENNPTKLNMQLFTRNVTNISRDALLTQFTFVGNYKIASRGGQALNKGTELT